MKQEKLRRAWEIKKINQARSSEEAIRLCRQYIYELHHGENERKEAARFCELEQKESIELKLIKENDPQYVKELTSEEEEEAEMESDEIEEEKDDKDEEEECDDEDNIRESLSSTNQMEHCDVLEEEKAEIKTMNRKVQKTKEISMSV